MDDKAEHIILSWRIKNLERQVLLLTLATGLLSLSGFLRNPAAKQPATDRPGASTLRRGCLTPRAGRYGGRACRYSPDLERPTNEKRAGPERPTRPTPMTRNPCEETARER